MEKVQPVTVKPNIPLFGLKDKYSKYPGNRVMQIENLDISGWDDLSKGEKTVDGLQINGNGFAYVKNVVIDRDGRDQFLADELASVVGGADVIFHNCRFVGNGKGYLQGTGDDNFGELLKGQRVVFNRCIFENCSRRNPFIQVGQGYLINCLIKNWGRNFHEKSHGIRAGRFGQVTAVNCIFEQESFLTCIRRWHTLRDIFWQQFTSLRGMPGFMRGAYADPGGHVQVVNCHKNRWWIYLQNRTGKMDQDDVQLLKHQLEQEVPVSGEPDVTIEN